jgi:4-diphosphocytidyl-2-C-methyl-D-erythritol kinase
MITAKRHEQDVWPAPAKLNLMLRVLGRRADGYHRLQTVFQFLDYADALRFSVNASGDVRRLTPQPGLSAEQDLTCRAARLLQRHAGVRQGVDIALHKRIPMGGGLGGGSSDAATTLVALNQLWGLGLSRADLAELGLSLGADVPIFVHARAAWAEGVGERFEAIEPPTPWYLVLVPDCHVSTGKVFASTELTRDAAPIKIADFLAGETGNSCESLVRRDYPAVAAAMNWLAQFGQARLTGTGACVFLDFAGKLQAMKALEQSRGYFSGFVARGLNRSPLQAG